VQTLKELVKKPQTISRHAKKTQEMIKTCQILRNVKIPPETSNLAWNDQKNPNIDQNVTSGVFLTCLLIVEVF